MLTGVLQTLLKPVKTGHDHHDVDKHEIGNHGDDVDVDLLVGLQVLDIDPTAA